MPSDSLTNRLKGTETAQLHTVGTGKAPDGSVYTRGQAAAATGARADWRAETRRRFSEVLRHGPERIARPGASGPVAAGIDGIGRGLPRPLVSESDDRRVLRRVRSPLGRRHPGSARALLERSAAPPAPLQPIFQARTVDVRVTTSTTANDVLLLVDNGFHRIKGNLCGNVRSVSYSWPKASFDGGGAFCSEGGSPEEKKP